MSFILNGTNIKAPLNITEVNSTQNAQIRTLNGQVNRDYFGDNKRVWSLTYQNTKKDSYDVIKALYDSYLSTDTELTWEVTETNYTVAQTTVHVDLQERGFRVSGSSYISDFTLVLTEA